MLLPRQSCVIFWFTSSKTGWPGARSLLFKMALRPSMRTFFVWSKLVEKLPLALDASVWEMVQRLSRNAAAKIQTRAPWRVMMSTPKARAWIKCLTWTVSAAGLYRDKHEEAATSQNQLEIKYLTRRIMSNKSFLSRQSMMKKLLWCIVNDITIKAVFDWLWLIMTVKNNWTIEKQRF